MAVDAKRFSDLRRVAESKQSQIADQQLLTAALTLVRPAYTQLETLGKEEGLGEERVRKIYLVSNDGLKMWSMSRPTSERKKYDGISLEGFGLFRTVDREDNFGYVAVRLRTINLPFIPPETTDDSLDKRTKLDLLELSAQNGLEVIYDTARALSDSHEIEPKVYDFIGAMANDCQVINLGKLTALGITA